MHSLKKLQNFLSEKDLDGFIAPMSDPFQNDFVPHHFRRIEFLSNFSGSLGTIVVLKKKAALFVDGRYILQAQNQVNTNFFDIEDYNPYSIISWILRHTKGETTKIGFDPWTYTTKDIKSFQALASNLVFEDIAPNPIDQIWGKDQPPLPCTEVFLHPDQFAGITWQKKVKLIKDTLQKHKLDGYLLTSSASVCWLLNIRAQDVPYTPICLSYAFIEKTGHVTVFLNLKAVPKHVKNHFKGSVQFKDFTEDLEEALSQQLQNKHIGYNESAVPAFIESLLMNYAASLEPRDDPCLMPKACKNIKQVQNIKEAHIKDGVALVRFYHWLDENLDQKITEKKASERIDAFRRMDPDLKDLSFPTIAGTRENASIVHYHAGDKSLTLQKGDLFLCDSGGQYFQGTTDVTRTVCLGKSPTDTQKAFYTAILKGMIDLDMAIFPEGTTGKQLDILARRYLWDMGHDYAHATGHGVGQYSNVHEGPQSISPRSLNVEIKPGMIISNEPGCYLPNDFGIRIENLMCVKDLKKKDSHGRRMLGFNTLTLCPIDTSCINLNNMNRAHIDWLNTYHQKVWHQISPFLEDDVLAWLKEATQKVEP